jgi:hypothetical protein
VLGGRPKKNTKCCHPPPKRIHELWQIFVDNVDPLTKVLHVPTVRPAIEKAVGNIEAMHRSFEALMFAIYSTAVMSLNDEDCREKLGEPRKSLLWRYINATRAALSRARFMGTTSLVVLQALVLHLLSVRDIQEPRAVWSLTGVAVRIAQGLGLERDGLYLGLSPFETEMRRRIWWLLKAHDGRTAELCGLHKFRDLDIGPESTKALTNVNDDQLYPGILSLPPESNSLTDIAFVALRYDLMNFAAGHVVKFRQLGKNISQWDRDLASGSDKLVTDETLKEIEGIIEMKYLRYCDRSQPLHLKIMLMARCSINTIRFLTHHPRRWASIDHTPLSERQWVWEVSVKLLEQHNMLQSNPQLKRFSWQAAYVMQWHAFIHVLDTLRANPLIADAERAWQLIASTYENNPAMIFDTRRHIHVAVGSLCLKAYIARVHAHLQNKNASASPTPEFIIKLSQQSEAAKLKKEARDQKNGQAVNSPYQGANSGDTGINAHSIVDPPLLDQQALFHEPQCSQTAGDSQFWFVDRFNNSRASYFNDVFSTSQDLMQAQDREENDPQDITWEQWDAWLADAMFPSS